MSAVSELNVKGGFAATDIQLGALCTHTLLNTMIDLWHLFYSSSKKQETKITQTKRHKQNTKTKTRFSIQQ